MSSTLSVTDMGGSEVVPVTEPARLYLSATGRWRRPMIPAPMPGRAARAGYRLTPDHAVGTGIFAEYLRRLPPGQHPYGDRITSQIGQLRPDWTRRHR